MASEERRNRLKNKVASMSREELEDLMVSRMMNDSDLFVDKEVKRLIEKPLAEFVASDIKSRIQNKEFIESLLFEKTSYSTSPSKFITDILSRSCNDEFFKDIRNEIYQYIKEHYHDICVDMMKRIFIQGLNNDPIMQSSISDAIYDHNIS